MPKNNQMPNAPFAVNAPDGVKGTVPESVLKRWNPDLVYNAGDDEQTDDNHISIMDLIGFDYWTGEGVTAKRIKAALRKIGNDQDVTVTINSPGGDVFEGLAIYNLLNNHDGHVTVNIIGVAASAAADIAMAGDTINIGRAAFLMIHNTWTCACGDQHAFREAADYLAQFDDVLVSIFSARTGKDGKDVKKMLDAETWMGGDDAIAQGFADGLLDADRIEAGANNLTESKVAHMFDKILAQHGMPRTERRAQIKALKNGTPSATDPATGTPSATNQKQIVDKLDEIFAKLKG